MNVLECSRKTALVRVFCVFVWRVKKLKSAKSCLQCSNDKFVNVLECSRKKSVSVCVCVGVVCLGGLWLKNCKVMVAVQLSTYS